MPSLYELTPKGNIVPNILGIYEYLSETGYKVNANEDNLALFKKDGCLLHRCYQNNLSTEIDKFIYDSEFEVQPEELVEAINKFGRSKIYSSHNWVILPNIERLNQRHTATTATFYFKDCYVTVTKAGVERHDLKQLNKLIYADQVVKRNFEPVNIFDQDIIKAAPNGHSFLQFLNYISSEQIVSDTDGSVTYNFNLEKQRYLMQLLGFLLHDYREKGQTDFCPIFCDNEEGGTGKGILMQAIEQLVDAVDIDAKNEKMDFSPEKLSEATRVKFYNDIRQNFNFEQIYNEITDSGWIRHMHKNKIIVPYADMWKVAILSNHIVRGTKGADRRRQKVFQVTPYFNENKSPIQEFGHAFFSDAWTETDWNYFYSIMLHCVRLWLKSDFKVYFNDPDVEQRRIEENYHELLRNYCDALPDGWHNTGELRANFKAISEVHDNRFLRDMADNKLSNQILSYLKETGRNPNRNKNRTMVHLHSTGKVQPPKPTGPGVQGALGLAVRVEKEKF